MEEVIKCEALGRMAHIGDLYDARRERFCKANIFKRNLPPSIIQTTDNQQFHSSYSNSNSSTEKFNTLDISGQLRVGILSKIVNPSGSAKYLSDEKTSNRAVRASLIYNVKTKSESLNIYNEALKPLINTNAMFHKQATHIVVGIQWGANAFLSIEHNNSNNKSERDIQAKLKGALVMVGDITEVGGKFNKEMLKETEDCSFTIYADLLPKKAGLLQTLEGNMNLMNQMLDLLKDSNNGKGKPLSYNMIPITMLQKLIGVKVSTDNLMNEIERQTIISIENLFNEVSIVTQTVNDIHSDIEKWKDCCGKATFRRIQEIKSKFAENEINLRSKLADAIIKFRSRNANSSVFPEIISKFHEDLYSTDKVRTMLTEFDLIIEKAKFIDDLKTKGVHFIKTQQALDRLFLEFQHQDIYILNYNMCTRKSNEALWESNRHAFFTLVGAIKNKNGPVCIFKENGEDRKGLSTATISIVHYNNGTCISEDIVADSQKTANVSLARSAHADPLKNRPLKRTFFEIKCPRAFENICKNANKQWQCNKCMNVLEYGFDDNVYCDCGGAAINCLTFKCNDPQHGLAYFQVDSKNLSEMVAELKPLREFRELNILVLGETGAGKSTWINGIDKYLAYQALEDVPQGKIKYLIPTEFTITDGELNEKLITMGSEDNECFTVGQSSTQLPKTYTFNTRDTSVRFIDTPGIGDTRGVEQDRENFQNILEMVGHYEEIHGICILLKPNNARLTLMFQFCIKELLTHLHKDCCKNIVFVFTNARNTFYRPGDTLTSLKKLLRDNKDVEIVLAKDTVYCMDNESIRFLAASNQGIEFNETEKENYSQSWTKSVIETNRLIDHFRSLKAHATQQTQSLNESRRLVLALTEPLAEIAKNIEQNLTLAENKRKEMEAFDGTTTNLKGKLMVPVIDLEPRNLDYPVTVCTSSKCIELVSIGENKKVNYKQICHDHCYLKGVTPHTYPNVILTHCFAMSSNGICEYCKCSWEVHMHITYECMKVEKFVVDENLQKLLKEKDGHILALKLFLMQIEDHIEQLNHEQTEITKTASKFGAFLKDNAITPYNDVMDQYLEHCISREKDQVAIGGNKYDLMALQKMLSRYREEVKILNEAMTINEKMTPLQPEDIKKLMESLFSLKITGGSLRKLMNLELSATKKAVLHNEVHAHGLKKIWNRLKQEIILLLYSLFT